MDTDQARFEELFAAHYGAIVRYATRRVGADHAGEVVSETFLVAWRRLSDIPTDAPRPWLYAVARHQVANELRSQRRRANLATRVSAAESVSTEGVDPDEIITEHMRVRVALATLSERDQEALRLAEWEQLDTADAAVSMGCSQAAFKVRLHRARRRLAIALGPPAPDSTAGTTLLGLFATEDRDDHHRNASRR